MASLSNINGLFDVHSTGAILFSTSHGTSGQILRSNGNAAPTWVDASTVIGGPYLPLSGGTLTGATATASGISFTVGGALTGTSATFTGNVGIGVTPYSHYTGYQSLDIGNTTSLISNNTGTNVTNLLQNAYLNSGATAWVRKVADEANQFYMANGEFVFSTAPSDIAGSAITWTKRLTIQAGGNVGIGTDSPQGKVDIQYDMDVDTGSIIGLTAGRFQYGNINFSGVLAQGAGAASTSMQGITWQINNYLGSTDYGNQAQLVVGNNGSIGTFMGFFTSDNYSNAPVERLRIDPIGNVGIGTTSPNRKLTVQSGSYSFPSGIDNNSFFTIAQNSWSGMTLLASTTTGSFIDFGDTDAGWRGRILYAHNGDYMYFSTAATERMRIDSSGQVKITSTGSTNNDDTAIKFDINSTNHIKQRITTSSTGGYQASLELESQGNAVSISTAGSNEIRFNTSSTERMLINSYGDVQIPTNSASLQLRSSGSASYTSIRRDSANQLIVANTAGNQVFGIGNGGELNINNGASYSAQYTYTSGWNSTYQTLIPGASLSPNAVYLVTIKCNSLGAAPYYASTVFHIATSQGTNGGGGSAPFNPPTATHVATSGGWVIRISTVVNGRNGLEGYLGGGPTNFNGATIYVKATKIMTM